MKKSHAHFEHQIDIRLAAPRAKVWRALTRDASKWWPRSFCIDPEATRKFVIEFRLGGRMYEDRGGGNGLHWWTIDLIDTRAYRFTFIGHMGKGLTSDHVDLSLLTRGKGTVLRIVENVTGVMTDAKSLRKSLREGWHTLFDGAFKPFIEKR